MMSRIKLRLSSFRAGISAWGSLTLNVQTLGCPISPSLDRRYLVSVYTVFICGVTTGWYACSSELLVSELAHLLNLT